ncbi:MAG: hypothetical protein JL50_19090 [Peptococcaceae bacterium BICA1-7]|nr:MAG: hypothetical protein JL50_19090 [Peptococcaceae bacterium BICA1-7]
MGSKSRLGLAACTLVVVLAVAPLPPPATAATLSGAVEKIAVVPDSTVKKATISLEKAIALAKEKVPVPDALDTFKSEYYENNGKGKWVLRWSGKKPTEANMQVTVDSGSGEIDGVSFYRSSPPGAHFNGLPAYSRDQCLKLARDEAARMFPDRFPGTVLVERKDRDVIPLVRDRDYPVVYEFYFQKTQQGIPVSDQGINIGINAENGELMRCDSSWDSSIKLPSPEGRVSPDKARNIFLEKAGYQLTYYMVRGDDPDSPGELKLVYREKPPGRFVLNALTGEIMDSSVMFYDRDMGYGGGESVSLLKSDKSALTPAEKSAVEENQKFITPDKAQEIASGALEIPEGYTVSGRNLERSYNVPGGRYWSISYKDSEGKNYIRVSVDARSGELISFSLDEPWDATKEPQVKFSQEEAVKIAGDFIRKMQPARSGQSEFRQSEPDVGPWVKMGSIVPGSYSIQYARVVNGVVFPENGFRVRVNSTTGKVTYYEMTWWETKFPGVGSVIGEAAANERYLADHPLKLEYGVGHQRWGMEKEPVHYLVYRPGGSSGVMLDALTGEEIDYRGKPVSKKGSPSFSDISGHPAEADIMLLAGEGIISGEGGKFRPDEPVTGAEELAMLVKAFDRDRYYPLTTAEDGPWYKTIFERAAAMGILDSGFTVSPEGSVSRIQLSRLGVNAAGWGKLARVHGIFNLDTADSKAVPAELRGYAAAALGLGLINAEKGSFAPDRAVTRGEAATFLVKLLKQ